MKAIYKVEWRDKKSLEIVTDHRKYCEDATAKGFAKVVAIAQDVAGSDEIVASVTMMEWERR